VKKLIFIRHGQAENAYDTIDFERKLTGFGIKEVRANSNVLKERGFVPEKIIASPTVRTKMTAENICDVLSISTDIIDFNKLIYENSYSVEFIYENLQNLDNKIKTVLFVGHNPSTLTTVQKLSGDYNLYFDTANAAVIEFDTDDWKNISFCSGELVEFVS
jgi:phosphohistidine phosphatase